MKFWSGRLLVGVVFFFNVQCAIAFIIRPDLFTWGFELHGETGEAMIRGLGVLFLMWNVPYGVAFWNPVKFRISLYEAIVMQAVGLAGESIILWLLSGQHPAIHNTVMRFIAFDGCGLIALLVSARITRFG